MSLDWVRSLKKNNRAGSHLPWEKWKGKKKSTQLLLYSDFPPCGTLYKYRYFTP